MSQPEPETEPGLEPQPQASTSESSPAQDAASLAKARREARKAKILAGGSDRLARITKSGRGEEAETLYSTHSPLAPSPSQSPSPNPVTRESQTSSKMEDHDDPEEIDISNHQQQQQQRERERDIMRSLQRRNDVDFQDQGPFNPQQQGPVQQQPQDPLQAMMAAMMSGGAGGAGGAPGGQAGENNPFGGLPFDPSQLMAMMGAGGGQNGPPGGGGAGLNINGQNVQSGKKTTLDRFFDLSHSLIFIFLGLFLAGSALRSSSHSVKGTSGEDHGIQLDSRSEFDIQPTQDAMGMHGDLSSGDGNVLQRWARLGYEKPTAWEAHYFQVPDLGILNLQGVPIFWLFISLEVMLQSTRIMIFRNRPTPSSLLYTISNYIPPQFSTFKVLLQTLASYWVLLSSLLNDLALLIFTVGIAILYSSWITGIGSNDSWGNSLGLGSNLGLDLAQTATGSEKVGIGGSGVGEPMPAADLQGFL